MKGEVTSFDTCTGTGVIIDQRGAEFPFTTKEWSGSQTIKTGQAVTFRPKGSKKGPFAARIAPVGCAQPVTE